MTTVQITINDSLPLSKLKTALSLIRGVEKIEIAKTSVETKKEEYRELKNASLNSSKLSMAKQINKYL